MWLVMVQRKIFFTHVEYLHTSLTIDIIHYVVYNIYGLTQERLKTNYYVYADAAFQVNLSIFIITYYNT